MFQYFFISQKLDEIGCNASHLAFGECAESIFSVSEEKIVLICSSSIFLDIELLKLSAVFETAQNNLTLLCLYHLLGPNTGSCLSSLVRHSLQSQKQGANHRKYTMWNTRAVDPHRIWSIGFGSGAR